MIPHKVLNIRCYICTCLALFFIFVFIRLLEYQILQFHAFLYIPFILHLSVYPVGVRGTLIGRLGMIHAGQLIERTLHEQGRTVTWFAGQLCCTRPNIYKIFKKENIDIHLLWRISCILDHDFFRDLSDNIRIGTSSCVSK